MARVCMEVWTTVGATPAAAMAGPAALASAWPLIGEVSVVPAGEEIFEVPGALTMAQQDEGGSHGSSLP